MPYKDKDKDRERQRNFARRPEVRQARKEYYEKNRYERLAGMKDYRKKNPSYFRSRNLAKNGWSLESYDAAFAEQQGLCAICKSEVSNEKYPVLSADHEHTDPPQPRGLLCGRCNKGLGLFLDSPELLLEAAKYINKFRLKKTQGGQIST